MKHPEYEINVRQGCIEVNSVAPLHLSEQAMLFEADTKQKYPEILGCGTGAAYVGAGDKTLRVSDPSAGATSIKICLKDELHPTGWHTLVEAGRYSIFIGMFKMNECKGPSWIKDL